MADSSAAIPNLHVDLSGTFGVVFWAFVVSTALFGVSIVQAYFYFMHGKIKDTMMLKIFVAVMIVLDFATTALSSQSLHNYLIVNFGNPLALEFMTVPYIVEYFITAVVTLGSQLFYATRIHIADKQSVRYKIPIIISALAVCAFGLAVGCTIQIFRFDRLIAGLEGRTMKILAGTNTGVAALCDIIATISMIIFLASAKSEYRQTKTIIHLLLFITINRGVLVAIAQLGFLTAYLAAPSKIYWMPFHLSISKLHVNTLLAMLNSRQTLRTKMEITQVRFSKDCTFNTVNGRELIRHSSAKSSLRLSGVAYELGNLSKAAEENGASPTSLSSRGSHLPPVTPRGVYHEEEGSMPEFSHPQDTTSTTSEV